jgi:hypothetical protein
MPKLSERLAVLEEKCARQQGAIEALTLIIGARAIAYLSEPRLRDDPALAIWRDAERDAAIRAHEAGVERFKELADGQESPDLLKGYWFALQDFSVIAEIDQATDFRS